MWGSTIVLNVALRQADVLKRGATVLLTTLSRFSQLLDFLLYRNLQTILQQRNPFQTTFR